MSTPTLDAVRTASIEQELMSIGTPNSRLQRHRRRVRAATFTVGGIGVAGLLTGGAIFISSLPGTTTVTPMRTAPVTGSFVGTADIDLGAAPADAAVVILDIACTADGGAMEVPTTRGGAVSWDCSDPIFDGDVQISNGALPASGTTSITITAAPGTEWSVVAQYGSSNTTEWGVNAHGQTYGVPNENGVPDLIASQATNGEQGYTLESEMNEFEGEGFINVYRSDGTTVIGKFLIGIDTGISGE